MGTTDISTTFISKLEYLDSCMKEAVRRYGILMLVRKAMVNTPFVTASGQEFIIPKGTHLIHLCIPLCSLFNHPTDQPHYLLSMGSILSDQPTGRMVVSSPALTHFNEELYPDPFLYDPERWADLERKQQLVSNRNYVQFGFGRHKCLVSLQISFPVCYA